MKKFRKYDVWEYGKNYSDQILLAWLNNLNKNTELVINTPKVLDVGCGDGKFAKLVCKSLNVEFKNYNAIEIHHPNIRLLQKIGFNVINSNLSSKIPVENEKYHIIISNNVLEHIYNTDRHFSELYRVLKPNGVVFLSTPNLAAINYRIMLLFGKHPTCHHPSIIDFNSFTEGYKHPYIYDRHICPFTWGGLRKFIQFHRFQVLKAKTCTIYGLPNSISKVICNLRPWGIYSNLIIQKSNNFT